ncbi:MAG: SDR family NAD(P)-dependent oxidoreductase [Candidatus Brocadiae bacterium]|nr:SDR family NAD(P)-dependent oxidoreductase [Candidatus Brocadiia bacterium]
MSEEMSPSLEGIAIVGMSCRYPGALSVEEFWNNLVSGVESLTCFSEKELRAQGLPLSLLRLPYYVNKGFVLKNSEFFDAEFFGYNPREAEWIDPQHRLFLECAWEALENAGYDPQNFPGAIGVYAGAGMNSYYLLNLASGFSAQERIESLSNLEHITSSEKDFLTTRVSYKLHLKGPSIDIQSACSTSLVAVSLACQSLWSYQSDMCLAGGVSVRMTQEMGYIYQPGGILSPDGHCRAFDHKAQGTSSGNGVGIVVLKRLQDAMNDGDHIYAVIKGFALNNDGSNKIGFTAPSVAAQSEVIAMAQAMAGFSPESISYIEAHGTGTPLGDPIEIKALTQAFRARTDKTGFCAIGSVKTNIGHTDAAAGVASLIKTALVLQEKKIPPNPYFEAPHPDLFMEESPFYVNKELLSVSQKPFRAGVSSFGMGGTNAHLVLEECPEVYDIKHDACPFQLIALSARSSSALEVMKERLLHHLQKYPGLALEDIAYTLQMGRRSFDFRFAFVCATSEQAISILKKPGSATVLEGNARQKQGNVCFLFPGQGSQYISMGKQLYETQETFHKQLDICAELLKPELGADIRELLYSPQANPRQLEQTQFTQSVLFSIEYALAKMWMKWGIKPKAMLGHSVGEYVCACLAGVMTLEDALSLVAKRGKKIQSLAPGSMLVVPLSEKEIRPLLGQNLALASINAPHLCVVSGEIQEIQRLESLLGSQDIETQRLHTSHAFHSAMMDSILDDFQKEVSKISLQSPKIPYISNVTGKWIREEEAISPEYWAKHIRSTVRFSEGIQVLLENTDSLFLEVGPGRTLSSLGRQQARKESVFVPSLRHPQQEEQDWSTILAALGKLWVSGISIDWNKVHGKNKHKRIPLPTYPFERQRFWVEPSASQENQKHLLYQKNEPKDWFYRLSWKKIVQGIDQKQEKETWAILEGCSGLEQEWKDQLQGQGHDVIMVEDGLNFQCKSSQAYSINIADPKDYDLLLEDWKKQNHLPQNILHLASLAEHSLESAKRSEFFGFYSLLFLVQALEKKAKDHSINLTVVSSGLYEINGNESANMPASLLLGLSKVVSQECPYIVCKTVDIGTCLPSWKPIPNMLRNLPKENTVAYRGKYLWTQIWERVSLPSNPSLLRHKGVYLITGGLGNIALLLAQYLAQTVQARLVLIGRSWFPEKIQWEDWLVSHPEKDTISQKIRILQSLEKSGSELLVLQADVASLSDMERVWDQTHEVFGKISGVLHTAGLTGKNSFQSISQIQEEECKKQFLPKIQGLLVLEKLLSQEQSDFCLLCSSLSSILGGIGFAAYSAANAFLDAFAQSQNQKQGTSWISVNWDAWEFENQEAGTPTLAILPEEGMEIFPCLFSKSIGSPIAVSTRDLNLRVEQLSALQRKQKNAQESVLYPRPKLSGSYIEPSSELEQALAEVWQEVLKIDKIGIHDNFFALGGHSLQAVQLVSKIQSRVKKEISVKTLFLKPNIADLAKEISTLPDPQETAVVSMKEKKNQEKTTSEHLEVLEESLSELIFQNRLPQVDSASLVYLLDDMQYTDLDKRQVMEEWCESKPTLSHIMVCPLGRIANIVLPVLASELYESDSLLGYIIEAIALAKGLGAKTVSLTGLIPSATQYGLAVQEAIAKRKDLPRISNGHTTTTAAVVLNIEKILQESGRNIQNEHLGFLGLGSIGTTTLRLMLRCLDHPKRITLCDLYSKQEHLESVKMQLQQEFGFRHAIDILPSEGGVPERFYDATMIVGATNVPGVLDIEKVHPGTLIVDDSAPHCYIPYLAIERFHKQKDILFTEGGFVQTPYPIAQIRSHYSHQVLSQIEALSLFNPYQITGCILSSLLSAQFPDLEPLARPIEDKDSYPHYQWLKKSLFQGARLHCESYVLDEQGIQDFREKWAGKTL